MKVNHLIKDIYYILAPIISGFMACSICGANRYLCLLCFICLDALFIFGGKFFFFPNKSEEDDYDYYR